MGMLSKFKKMGDRIWDAGDSLAATADDAWHGRTNRLLGDYLGVASDTAGIVLPTPSGSWVRDKINGPMTPEEQAKEGNLGNKIGTVAGAALSLPYMPMGLPFGAAAMGVGSTAGGWIADKLGGGDSSGDKPQAQDAE